MTDRGRLRWSVWIVLLASLGWLVAADQRQPQEPALADLPPRKAPSAAPASAPATGPGTAVAVRELVPRDRLIAKRPPGASVTDLFASRIWAPPPPPVSVRTAPLPAPALAPVLSAPVAPAPPPFTYLGKHRDEQGWQVYLGVGERALIVREGDAVEGGYRVESIKPPILTLARADGRQQIAIGEGE